MDFQQGLITTIHEYGVTKELLKELNRSKKRSTAILIPCLFEEFERPALRDIKEVLRNLTGLNELVIALSAKTIDQQIQQSHFLIQCHSQFISNGPILHLLLNY